MFETHSYPRRPSGFASWRALSMKSCATGLIVRFLTVMIPTGNDGAGKSTGKILSGGRFLPKCNKEHFIWYPSCGGWIDCRDSWPSVDHEGRYRTLRRMSEGPLPHPAQNSRNDRRSVRNSNRRHTAQLPRPKGLCDGGRAVHQKQEPAQHGRGQKLAKRRRDRGCS